MANMTLNLTLNSNGSIKATWSAVSGAVRYHAYMSVKGEGTAYYNQTNLKTTSYTSSSKLTAGKTYRVVVTAYSSSKSLGSASAQVLIPSDFYKNVTLGVPQNVSATASAVTATVKWSAVSGATGYDVLFNGSVYSVTGTSKTISGLKAKTSYSYAVRAKTASKTGSYSATKTVTTLAQSPAVPSNIKKTVTETSATISWGAVSGATGYTLVFNGSTYNVTTTSKTFSGLKAGTAYTFKLCAKNAGATSAYTNNITVTTAPKAPTTITATSTSNSVTLKWNAVSGATGYILRFGGTDYVAIGTSNTFTGLTANKSYTYQICSRSADGAGSYSTAKSISTLAKIPTVPANIQKSATDSSVTISWPAVSGATSYDLLFNNKTYSVTSNSKTITGLSANTRYTYQVRAKSSSGNSAYSSAQTVTTTPKPPASASATAEEDNIVLSWNAVTGATGYEILFNGKVYSTASATTKIITGLSPNTSYNYQIRVKNADGVSAYSAVKTVQTAPNPPAGASVTAAKNSVTLSWNPVSGATSYDVLFNGTVRRVTGTTITISGLQPGTSYSYSIRSNNAGGSSTYSTRSTVATLPNPPALPANVKISVTQNTATVTWDAVSGATSYDVKFNGTEYRVTGTSKVVTGLKPATNYSYSVRANNAGGSSVYTAAKVVQTLPNPPAVPTGVTGTVTNNSVRVSWGAVTGADSYDVSFNGAVYRVTTTGKEFTGLAANTSYSYQVRANNAGGSSSYSASQSVKTLPNPPSVPTNVNATATADSITVSWSAVSGATSYDVIVGDTARNVTASSVTVSGLNPGTDYVYKVRARNVGGTSAYSTEKTIRTLLLPPQVPQEIWTEAKAHEVEVIWNSVEMAESYDILFDGIVYNTTGTSKIIENLAANTVYSFKVRAKNTAGTSDYSTDKTVRTLLDTPTDVSATATTKTAMVRWNAVDGATSYDVKFNGTIYNTTDTFKEITGLKSETDYSYLVCAKNEYVESEYSKKQSVTTLRPGPAEPADITAVATMNCVIVSWSPVPEADDYDVCFDGFFYNVKESGTVSIVTEDGEEVSVAAQMYSANSSMMEARKADALIAETAVYETEKDNAVMPRIYKIFAGLRPNTKHTYCARANNEEGSSHSTSTKSIMTGISKRSGLPRGKMNATYPDGRMSYTGLDPVNALNGAFLWSYTWLEDHGKDALHFTTMYDSQREDYPKVLGRKWTHALNYLLNMDEEYAYFSTPGGDVIPFARDAENERYEPVEGMTSTYSMERKEDGCYVIKDIDGAEYVFDSNLCLNHMVENGLVTYRFKTDEAGQIVGIEGRHGKGLSLTYKDGRIATVADAMGNITAFTYAGDDLITVVNPIGQSMRFEYDDAGNLLTITDFSGRNYLTNEYDVQGRVVTQTMAGRGESSVVYDEENGRTVFVDELGNATKYTYDEVGHITAVELAGVGMQNKYNANGQITEQVDALGNTTKMTYDERGRMNQVIYPDGSEEKLVYNERNLPIKVVNRDGTQIQQEYDERNNLVTIWDERGNTACYAYDENDNLVAYTDKNGNVWTYNYDENNHLKQAKDPEGGIYQYEHDAIGRMTAYTTPEGKAIAYQYSAAGDLLSITDADGTVAFAYNENGSKTGVTDKLGNKQRLEYNAMGQVSLATDFLGNEYHFSYDQKGNLIKETDPLGYGVSYAYDAMGNRTAQTDKNGEVTRYSFDALNRLTEVRDAAGGSLKYVYDAMGQVQTVIDPLEHQTSYSYDKAGRIINVADALGNNVSYTYDDAGNLLTKTDENGVVTTYAYDAENRVTDIRSEAGIIHFTYDSLGRILSVEDVDGYIETAQYDGDGNIVLACDKEKNQTTYAYDTAGRLTEVTAPNDGKTVYTYDKNGNCIMVTDAGGNEYAYEYDANGHVIKVTDPLEYETVYEYDARGQLAAIIDAKGGKTAYEYDGNGNLVKETNPLGGVKTYTYDCLNRLTEMVDEEGYKRVYTYDAGSNVVSYTDANENCRTYEYDALNRLTEVTDSAGGCLKLDYTKTGRIAKVTDQEGAETNYRYDSMGRLIEMSDALEHSTSFTYDSLGRMLSQTDAGGNTTEYTYSPSGNLLSMTDAEGNTTDYTYNALGQMLTQTDAMGNTVAYEYDALGQVIAITDALGAKTAFTYTADGRIATVTDAGGNVTNYCYDACGNLTQTVDALGNVVVYEYDAMNNQIKEYLSASGEPVCATLYQYDKRGCMIREINPMSEEKVYTYDGNGNIVKILDEDKDETTVRYDLNNKPVYMGYNDGKEAVLRYNKRGELVELKDWNGTVVLEHDCLGRLTKVTDHDGRSTSYGYDAVGNRTNITYPDGSVVGYAYDKNRRLTKVTDTEGVDTQYIYNPAGHLMSLKQPGSVISYTCNAKGMPVQIGYGFDDGTAMEESFAYDAVGHIIASERKGSTPELTGNTAYAYDAIGRLLSYREGETTEFYSYDALGNRISKKVNGSEQAAYSYNALNQLVSVVMNGEQYSYGYDKRGNLTEERKGNSLIRQYTYDATNHLAVGRNVENGEKTQYDYNALYMRVKNVQTRKDQNANPQSKEVSYVPDYLSRTNNDLIAYEKGAGVTRAVYGRGYECLSHAVIPQAETAVTEKTYFQPDIMGSPRFAANEQGTVLRYAKKNAWGVPQEAVGTVGLEENLRYTNYHYDSIIGKYYAQARFYDAVNGRMVSKDPVKNGLNAYVYCGNDPVDYVDPTGEVANILIGAGLGAVSGGFVGFVGSAASQWMSGEEIDWKKACGAAVNGAITGGARGAIISSGAGFGAALAADFIAGTAGSAAEQKISNGSVNWRKSVTGGLTNMVSGAIQGRAPFENIWSAMGKSAGAGAATAAINYLSDALDARNEGYESSVAAELLGGMAARWAVPYVKQRDPKTICGIPVPFQNSIGYRIVQGYQFTKNYGESQRKTQTKKGFDFKEFMKEVVLGAVMGGMSGAAFYGGGKALDVLRSSVRGKSGKTSIPTKGQMHDAITQWARMEESLANSKTQLSRFNTASVVYDSTTDNYFYGMNRGIQVSGDNLNSSLKSWLPEKSLNDYKLGNCAEVDAINQALNSGANINGLYMYTINTKTNLPKPMCENCSYTFWGRVADVFSN